MSPDPPPARAPRLEILPDAAAAARRGAEVVAGEARAAVRARGRFTLALSGGRTPWAMLAALAASDVPWASVQVFQVDERVAPAGDPERNLPGIEAALLSPGPLAPGQIQAMAVEDHDLEAAALRYSALLGAHAGIPPRLDLVHLGLGADGHTASLFPGDPLLAEEERDVAVTTSPAGRRRLTLTLPVLRRARRRLWIVTGAEKAAALARLARADPGIPAGLAVAAGDWILADRAAAER
ncbi:MAG: 6-phosphogluconolactonase [Planctomycetota bacterium]